MQALWGSAQMAPPTLTQLSSSGPAHSVQDGEAITYLCANQPLVVVLKFREIDPTPNTVGSMGQNMESSANGVPGVQFVHLRHLMSVSLVMACTITCIVASLLRLF